MLLEPGFDIEVCCTLPGRDRPRVPECERPVGPEVGDAYGDKPGKKAGAPEVIPGTPEVRGSLDKEIIRRIIRRHINEVKFCYERELVKSPNLMGRVMVQFTISNPSAPHQTVGLSGVGGTSCFLVQPAELNYGTVGISNGQFCSNGKRKFVGVNGCAQSVTIQSTSLEAVPLPPLNW